MLPLTFRAKAAVVLAAVVALAGCGADDPSGDGVATGSGEFPVTVEHAYGDTTIPSEPKRVVTVGVTEQDIVWALGVKPVGVTEWYGDYPYAAWPWADDARGDSEPEVLTTADGLQFERIASLEPDLIIGTNAGLTEEDYARLSGIAPTIAHSGDYSMYFEPWDVQALQIGTALGKQDEVEQQIAAVKEQFAEAAAAHPEFADTKIVFLQNQISNGNAIAYQEGLSTDFVTALGFEVPEEIDAFAPDDGSGGQAYIPLENIGVLNSADVLIWGTEKDSDRTALENEPLVAGLGPMSSGQVVYTDAVTAGAIYFTSLLSLPHVIDVLVPALADALAGEGPSATS